MKSKEETLRDQIPSIKQVKTRYRPIRNDLLIIPLPAQSQTASGIILPDRSKIIYDEGHIVAMGNTASDLKDFSLGDCVTWNRTDANVFEDEGSVKLVLLNANNVLMKISVDLLKADSIDRLPKGEKKAPRYTCNQCLQPFSKCACSDPK